MPHTGNVTFLGKQTPVEFFSTGGPGVIPCHDIIAKIIYIKERSIAIMDNTVQPSSIWTMDPLSMEVP